MSTFILRRIISTIPVLFGILLVTFSLNRAIPGDPCRAMLGERATQVVCDAYIARYGLDQPIPVQFGLYLRNVLQGDLGQSARFGGAVTELLAERLPTTIELATSALFIAVIVGIPLGIISAYWRNSRIDVATMLFANIGVSMPVFWLGLMLSFFFSVTLKETPFVLPPSGRLPAGYLPTPYFLQWGLVEDVKAATPLMVFLSRFNILNGVLTLNTQLILESFRHMILPAAAVSTIPMAIIARMTRASLLDALGQDYTRTARAKGLREMSVVVKHAVRNSLLPVVTIIGLNFGGLVSGAVLTETIFGFSGIGRTLFEGITARDYSLVQGVTLVTAVSFVIINLVVDILYGYLDPRIRLS
jgi:peptide/nickel transport system permease protein